MTLVIHMNKTHNNYHHQMIAVNLIFHNTFNDSDISAVLL